MYIKYKKRLIKRALGTILLIIIVGLLLIIFANWKIPHDTRKYTYNSVDSIPTQKVAVVLGTAKNIGGYPNPYFSYRIEAAADLYKAGKVKAFIVSGDHSRESYNEPEDMRESLIQLGVPDSIIYSDYAGLRTLDSVVRAHEIFGQDSMIIVSQKFHNERAIYLAQNYGIKAYGYNAKDLKLSQAGAFKTQLREKLARVKVFIDLFTNKSPKYLGDPITIK